MRLSHELAPWSAALLLETIPSVPRVLSGAVAVRGGGATRTTRLGGDEAGDDAVGVPGEPTWRAPARDGGDTDPGAG